MGKELVTYEEKWAEEADRAAADEKIGGPSSISTQGGVFSLGDEELGSQLCVVILDAVRLNTYYGRKWRKGQDPMPPKCFAIGRSNEEMEPHEAMVESEEAEAYFEPQSDACGACDWNVFGSADEGDAKACQNRRRLAVIPAGFYELDKKKREEVLELFDDEKDFAESEIALLTLPVTSVRNWSKYVNFLKDKMRRPPWGVVTRVFIQNQKGDQFKVDFELLEELSGEFFDVLEKRHDEGVKETERPYLPPKEEDGGAKRQGIRGLKKKRATR